MTHEDLLEIGFRLRGVDEDDPYYRLVFMPPFNFNIHSLAGVLEDDVFWLWGNDSYYTDKDELQEIVNVLGGEINFDIVSDEHTY